MSWTRTIGSWIDEAIYAIAPAYGAQRKATREIYEAKAEHMRRIRNRAYESAEQGRLRDGRWLTSNLSADADLKKDLVSTRKRSRDLYRNDHIGGAIESRVEHVVGTGFTVQSRVKELPGVITADQARLVNTQLELLYEQVEPTACRTRRKSLWEKVALAARLLDVDGEAFVVFSDIGNADAKIPLCVEVIDADRVETPPEHEANPRVRMGVRYNNKGQINGYYIRKTHPNDDKETNTEYDFIPAPRMQHLYVEWFAGQSRGLPWMTRTLNKSKDGKDYAEAAVISAQVEQCFAAFIRTKANPLAAAIGGATSSTSTNRIQDILPATVNYLGQDDEIFFANPTKSNSIGTLMEYNNRTIAGGTNWPYEMLMKDWRGVSFAGGRIVLNAARITTRVRQRLIERGLLRPFWNRMVDEAVIIGEVDIDPRLYRDNLFAFRRHAWSAPRWSYALTPSEEVNAIVTAIDNNLMTKADALSEMQLDFEEVAEQRQFERTVEREKGIESNETMAAESTPSPTDQGVFA